MGASLRWPVKVEGANIIETIFVNIRPIINIVVGPISVLHGPDI